MADPNRALFEAAVRLLAPMLDELVFVGGSTTGLFLTDPMSAGIRATRDVDAIVDVATYAAYAQLSEELLRLGLRQDESRLHRSRSDALGHHQRTTEQQELRDNCLAAGRAVLALRHDAQAGFQAVPAFVMSLPEGRAAGQNLARAQEAHHR